jgi:hypothetical protein
MADRIGDVRFVPITDAARRTARNNDFAIITLPSAGKNLLGFSVGGAFADIVPDCKRDEAPG